MYQIVCSDAFGQTHDVPAEIMKLRSLAYGVLVDSSSILLVQDKGTGLWEYPGGELDKTLSELEGLKRNVVYESGIIISSQLKLIHIMEEDYYDVNVNEGLHATRMFYQVTGEGGTILATGNGGMIAVARYFPLDEVKRFSDKQMKPKYREVLDKIQQ